VVKPLVSDALVTAGKNPAVPLGTRKAFAVAVKNDRTETRFIAVKGRPGRCYDRPEVREP